VRALADDGDLRRIEPIVSSAGQIAGAAELDETSRAIDALHGVIWSAIREELRHPDPDQVSELAERLVLVIGQVRSAALRGGTPLIGALEEEIGRARHVGSPLSLVLIDLNDADRMMAVEQESARDTFDRFVQAVRSVVRGQDIVASESESRTWMIARDTGRADAIELASRAAEAVRAEEPWRGAPLTVSAGIAVLGEDGGDTASLIEAAEQAVFLAAASGIDVAGSENGEHAH
jgi:GGDEF domain-containing protein